MKLYKVLFKAIAILALFGSCFGEEEEENTGCPLTHDSKKVTFRGMMEEHIHSCITRKGQFLIETSNDTETLDYFEEKFADFCHRQELMKICLSESFRNYSSLCLNENDHVKYQYFVENTILTLSKVCINDGKVAARAFSDMYASREDNRKSIEHLPIIECASVANSSELINNDQLEAALTILGVYRNLKVFKKCIVNKFRGMNRAVFFSEMILNEVIRTVNCPRPDDGTKAICLTLDTSGSTEESVCPFVKQDDPDHSGMLQMFSDQGIHCMKIDSYHLVFDNLDNFKSVDKFETFFRNYCQNQPHILNCLDDVLLNSNDCQNETEHQVYGSSYNFLQNLIIHGCKQDAKLFVDIFHGLYLKIDETAQDTVLTCLRNAFSVLKSTRDINPEDNNRDKVLRIYRAVATLKDCVASGVNEETVKTAFAKFTEDVLEDLKCASPSGVTTVSCHSLAHSES